LQDRTSSCGDEAITRPDGFILLQYQEDVFSSFTVPARNVFVGDIGGEMDKTAGAASSACYLRVFFHGHPVTVFGFD